MTAKSVLNFRRVRGKHQVRKRCRRTAASRPSCTCIMNSPQGYFAICFRYFFVLSFLACEAGPSVACPQPANEPLEKFVVTDGVVCAIAHTNHVIYFGGSFGCVGVRTGSGVPVSA